MSNVSTFDESSENAARRFIALVDELYDRNVNLILSAAAGPAKLYHGDKLEFEFQRTASRLIEMQSEAYLARPHRPKYRLIALPRSPASRARPTEPSPSSIDASAPRAARRADDVV